jgi:hypothetical protein
MQVKLIKKNISNIIIFGIFSIVVGFFVYNHDCWRDEIEFFLYRKHLGIFNPGDPCYIIYNIPANIFLLLGNTIQIYKLYNILLILISAWIIIFISPFNILEKALFVFSYYSVYEYGIMSRYYGMLLLIILIIASNLSKKTPSFSLLALLIILLADINAAGTIFSICITAYIALINYINFRRTGKSFWNNWDFKIGISILTSGYVVLGIVFKIYLLKLSKKLEFNGGVPPAYTAINSILNAYFPIPALNSGTSFWSTHIFPFQWVFPPAYNFSWSEITPFLLLSTALSIGIFFIILAKFSDNKPIFIIYLVNSILLIGLFMFGMKAFPSRYLGLLFLVFLYCYWLYKASSPVLQIFKSRKLSENIIITPILSTAIRALRGCFKPLLYVILTAHIISNLYVLNISMDHKFTLSQDAAAYIKWNNYQKTHVLVGYPDYASQCISAHLDQKIYYPQQNAFAYASGDFLDNFKKAISSNELVDACLKFSDGDGKNVLLILNFPIMADQGQMLTGPTQISKNSIIRLLHAVTGDVINKDEQFWLYEVTKVK